MNFIIELVQQIIMTLLMTAILIAFAANLIVQAASV